MSVGFVGTHPRHPQTWTRGGWYPPPLLLTPSGSHYTYSRQAGGTHPNGMYSCGMESLLGRQTQPLLTSGEILIFVTFTRQDHVKN